MSGQTTMNPPAANGAAKPATTVEAVTSHASSLAHDLITLAELQVKLLFIDFREAVSRSAASAVAMAAMLALILSALSVFLLGIAEILVEYANWHRSWSLLAVGGVGALIAVVFGWICFKRLQKVATVLSRSHQELQANLEFVKSLVESQIIPPNTPSSSGGRRAF